jgi:ABC-type uncharacterized transport system substrate-binding protein
VWFIIKRLALGVILIALAATVLLVSDWRSRRPGSASGSGPARKSFKIGVLQHSSQSVLVDGVKGMLDALAEKGFVEGPYFHVQRYNAEGDMPTENTIAKEITDGRFDMILTASTPAMQAVANANKACKTTHVFALVTDPAGAGVGINPQNHLEHPPCLAGFGTFQPVEAAFKTARQMRPELKSVGVIWNSAEANSEANVKVARQVCKTLGIDLLEATVDNSSGVLEAANSLVSRGVEALWVGGDNTVLVAIDSMIQAGKKARIPVFTVIPPHAEKGALFDIGANYYEVGRLAGDLAAEILNGRDPASVSIENVVPEMFVINKLVLQTLRDKWQLPAELAVRADVLVDETGTHRKEKPAVVPGAKPGALTKKWRISQFSYAENPILEEVQLGVAAGFKEAGLVEGRDFEMKISNAQGDMATLSSLIDAALSGGADMLLAETTPALQGSLKRAKDVPVVFNLVANPFIAGAGKSDNDHLSNVTGCYSVAAFDEMVVALKQCLPNVKRVGTLFAPAEVNSVFYKDKFVEAASKAEITIEALGVSNSGEVPDGALALCNRNIDVFCQISDNLSGSTFASIAQATKRAHIPLFGFTRVQAEQGAILSVARDYYENGRESAVLAARVMRGESPSKLPFEAGKTLKLFVNLQAAEAHNVKIPNELVKKADGVIGKDGKMKLKAAAKAEKKPLSKKWNVHIIEYVQVVDVEEVEKGVLAGLDKAGLVRGQDFEVKVSNAHSDMPTLSGLVDAAVSDGADLLITVSTPTLQAAIRRAKSVPIVFTYCANSAAAGAAKSLTDHLPNLTGVEIPGAYDELVAVVRECLPGVKAVGTLYAPSEVNTVFHKEKITKAAAALGITMEAVAAETSSEISDAALALCNRKIDAVCQVGGNLTAASFPSIARAAQAAHLPLFASLSSQAEAGAAVAVARDYYFAGIDTGLMAARVMRGEKTSAIPIEPFAKTKIIVNLNGAKACGLTVPASVLKRADQVIGSPSKSGVR